jgi:hypothetical protein
MIQANKYEIPVCDAFLIYTFLKGFQHLPHVQSHLLKRQNYLNRIEAEKLLHLLCRVIWKSLSYDFMKVSITVILLKLSWTLSRFWEVVKHKLKDVINSIEERKLTFPEFQRFSQHFLILYSHFGGDVSCIQLMLIEIYV